MRILLILTAIFISGYLVAQDYNTRIFTTADGLPISDIGSVNFDSHGYLWMGSPAGFCRFDGRSFTSFTTRDGLKNNIASRVYEDKDHRLWTVSYDRIYLFDHARFNEIPIISEKAIRSIFWFLQLADGKIIFSSLAGTFLFTGKDFKPCSLYGLPQQTVLRTIVQLPNQQLVTNTSSAIYAINPDGRKEILLETARLKMNDLYDLILHNNKIYFYNADGVYELTNRNSYHVIFNKSVQHVEILSVFIDSKNNFWVSTSVPGLYLLNSNGEKNLFVNNGFIKKYPVWAMTEDKWGNIWAASYQGLIKFSPSLIDEVLQQQGAENLFRNIYKAADCFYFFGSEKCIYRYRHGQEDRFSSSTEKKIRMLLNNKFVSSVATEPDGNLLICSNFGGLFELSARDFNQIPLAVSVYHVVCAKHKIFLSGRNVFYELRNHQCMPIDSMAEGQPLERINGLITDEDGNVWICDNQKIILYRNGTVINISRKIGLTAGSFFQILCNHYGLWIAGTNGVLRLTKNVTGEWQSAGILNRDNGMANEQVLSLGFDHENNLWYSTPTGVYRSQLNIQNDSLFISFTRKFGEAEGINNTIWDSGPIISDEEGNIWVAAINAILRINTHNIPQDTLPPVIQIEKAELTRAGQDWRHFTSDFSNYHNLPLEPKLSYRQNSLNIYFSGVTMQNAAEVKYNYELEGYDKQWSNVSSNQMAVYTNLPAGKYRFRVKAMNADGVWSRPEEFVFSIAPPFWQTWWFRIAAALFIIAILYYFIRRREKNKIEKNQIALQIAELKLQTLQSQMNPHFIFNSLNSVQKYILDHNPAEGARYLSKFSKLIRKILENSRHNLLHLHQIVETLEMYIELESLRFNREFSYELLKDEDDEVMNRKLPPMLLQPFVENAIWHGLMPKEGEKKLLVAIQKKNGQLYCLIEDNGVGREKTPAAEEGHISRGEKMIRDMTESLQQLLNVKVNISITDLNGVENRTGTRVEIFIPESPEKFSV